MEIEAEEYNRKFVGYEGFTNAEINKNIRSLRGKARTVIGKLEKRGVDVYELQDNFEGITVEGDQFGLYGADALEYALQFI